MLYIKVGIIVFVLFLLFLFMPCTYEETDKSKSINNAIRKDKENATKKDIRKLPVYFK